MAAYFRNLWTALLGNPKTVTVSTEYLGSLHRRLAEFEKRSAAGRKSHETRKAKATPSTPQFTNTETTQ